MQKKLKIKTKGKEISENRTFKKIEGFRDKEQKKIKRNSGRKKDGRAKIQK